MSFHTSLYSQSSGTVHLIDQWYLQESCQGAEDPRVPRDALNQMPSWDQHWLQASSVETHVGVPPVCEALGYSQLLTLQVSDISSRAYEFPSVANGQHLAWYTEQHYPAVVVAVLTVPFPFQICMTNPLPQSAYIHFGTFIQYTCNTQQHNGVHLCHI